MHPWCARDLRQVHRAKFTRADQADADRVAIGSTFLKFGIEVHIGFDLPQFHGRLNVSKMEQFKCNRAGLFIVLGCRQRDFF
jgi:hypothetical protein